MFVKLNTDRAAIVADIEDFHKTHNNSFTTQWVFSSLCCKFFDGRPAQVLDLDQFWKQDATRDEQAYIAAVEINLSKYSLSYHQWVEVKFPFGVENIHEWMEELCTTVLTPYTSSAMLTSYTKCVKPDNSNHNLSKLILLMDMKSYADFNSLHAGKNYRYHPTLGLKAFRKTKGYT